MCAQHAFPGLGVHQTQLAKYRQVKYENKMCPGPASSSQGSGSGSDYDTQSPSPPPRPNKFHGHPSTWRTWTAAERELAASLDQLRARDLAVHLYNAHALKRRARAIDRQRQRGELEREVNGKAWVPPKVWTAWPMGPDEVPREGETKVWEDGVDLGSRKRRRITEPSEALADAITGEILRNATQRFRSRRWDGEEASGSLERSSEWKSRDEGNSGNEQPIGSDVEDDEGSENESHSEAQGEGEIGAQTELESGTGSESMSQGNGQTEGDSSDGGQDDVGRRWRRMTTRSQSRDAKRSGRSQVKSEDMSTRSLSRNGKSEATNVTSEAEDSDTMEPVLMADDERAHDILQPTVHHVLAKLDHLLMGLHQARQAYLPGAYHSASETQTDAEELSGVESGKKRSRTGRSKSRSRVSKNKRSRDVSMRSTRGSRDRNKAGVLPPPVFEDSQNQNSPPRNKIRKPRRRKSVSPDSRARSLRKSQGRLGLRDWSDVFAIASMTGWDSAVVTRAAARCAALFEEGITFRTLEEGTHGANEVSFLPNDLLREEDHAGKDESMSEEAESEDEMLGGVHVDGFLKPIQAKKSWKVHRV